MQRVFSLDSQSVVIYERRATIRDCSMPTELSDLARKVRKFFFVSSKVYTILAPAMDSFQDTASEFYKDLNKGKVD